MCESLLAVGRLARPRAWSCTSAQSCAIAQWLKGAAAPTLRAQTKSVHGFYCTGRHEEGGPKEGGLNTGRHEGLNM